MINPTIKHLLTGITLSTIAAATVYGQADTALHKGYKGLDVKIVSVSKKTDSNIIFRDGARGIDTIDARLILDTRLSYEPTKGLRLFCTAKNLLNDKSREFFRS